MRKEDTIKYIGDSMRKRRKRTYNYTIILLLLVVMVMDFKVLPSYADTPFPFPLHQRNLELFD